MKPQATDGTLALEQTNPVGRSGAARIELDEDQNMALIEFASSSYAVLESEQRVTLEVVRYGQINTAIRFR